VSCAINTLLAHERYDAPRQLFDGRAPHDMRLLDAAAQASHLTYEYLNPVAAGLVARPEHMPGVILDLGHWKSGGVSVQRPTSTSEVTDRRSCSSSSRRRRC
jgi:hypothetical protein